MVQVASLAVVVVCWPGMIACEYGEVVVGNFASVRANVAVALPEVVVVVVAAGVA